MRMVYAKGRLGKNTGGNPVDVDGFLEGAGNIQ